MARLHVALAAGGTLNTNTTTTFNIPYLFLSKGDNFRFFYKFDKVEIDF